MGSPSTAQLHRLFTTFCLLGGAVQAWQARHFLNGDGVSYLDMASGYLAGDWRHAANGYWPPLYSVILAAVLGVLRPPGSWELTAVHGANFLIFAGALAAFRFFLSNYLGAHGRAATTAEAAPLSEATILIAGYSLFASTALILAPLAFVTPDLCLAALVYLTAGLLLKVEAAPANWRLSLAVGAVLGVGFLTKTVLLPLGLVFVATAALAGRRIGLWASAVTLTAFAAVVALHLLAVHRVKGRVAIGDMSRLNYAWTLDGRDAGGTDGPRPVRELLDRPRVLGFDTALPGTYPLGYDPTIWDEREHPSFQWRYHWAAIHRSVLAYKRLVLSSWQLGFGLTAATVLWLEARGRPLGSRLLLLAPAMACFVVYALVRVQPRYLPAFLTLWWMGLLLGARLRKEHEQAVGVMVSAVAVVALAATVAACVRAGAPDRHWKTAEQMLRSGLRQGDRVAVIGAGSADMAWARLARAKVAAQIRLAEAGDYWAAPAERRQQVRRILEKENVRAVVAVKPEGPPLDQPWQHIAGTSYWYMILP